MGVPKNWPAWALIQSLPAPRVPAVDGDEGANTRRERRDRARSIARARGAQLDAGLAEIDLSEVNADAGDGTARYVSALSVELDSSRRSSTVSSGVRPTPEDCDHQHSAEERSHNVTL